VLLRSQNDFAKDYRAGEAAYKKGDLKTAEKMFLASLRSSDTTVGRGDEVRLVGKQYGYYPEFYLTLVYQREHRYSDVLSYAARALEYLKEKDSRFKSVRRAYDEALQALSNIPDDRSITWTRPPAAGQSSANDSFALIIGINHYDDPERQTLKTPIPDGVSLTGMLHDGYGFETTFLPDPKHDEILNALDKYQSLSDTSSLLIYYAGHGVHVTENDKNYWLPRDAPHNQSPKWIEASEITSRIKAIRARHVLLVADSCYSGLFTKGDEIGPAPPTKSEHAAFVRSSAAARSRRLLSSGFDEPVPDIGVGNHSKFAAALLTGLGSMPQASFTASELFSQFVQQQVTAATGQRPQYIPITEAAHGGGDFVFYRVQSK
jgi:tetratricopeptide (TPR) repeat protein